MQERAMNTVIEVQDDLIATMVTAVGTKSFLTTLNAAMWVARKNVEKLGLSYESAKLAIYDAIDMGYLEIACLPTTAELALKRARAALRRFGDDARDIDEQLGNEGFPGPVRIAACRAMGC